jgi:hypothetical protein
MAETLHRIVYHATIDDAVDVALRLAYQTQAFRKQIRNEQVRLFLANAPPSEADVH